MLSLDNILLSENCFLLFRFVLKLYQYLYVLCIHFVFYLKLLESIQTKSISS